MKARKWSKLSDKLVGRLARLKPEFRAVRTLGSVRIDMNGSTVGYVEVAAASANVGTSFKSKREYGGQALAMAFSKDDQIERKRVAYTCAFLCYLLDERPSEERRQSPRTDLTDPKNWFTKFDKNKWTGEHETCHLEKELTTVCRTLIDVFHEVKEAVRSARREDVSEAVNRVKQDLPFLIEKLSEEEWAELYRVAVVDGVHKL